VTTTAYVTNNEWAEDQGETSFANYTTNKGSFPSSTLLTRTILKASRIMNNREHLNTSNTNITDTEHLETIKDYVISMTNRMLDVKKNRGFQGGMFTFSPQDFLYIYERNDILQISFELGYRKLGDVG